MTRKNNSNTLGQAAEDAAAAWLRRHGLIDIEKNFRCKGGEIDLIMLHRNELVFVEVRLRSSSVFGSAAESVTSHKRRRVIRAAHYFLTLRPRWQNYPCRFDVLAATTRNRQWEWDWLQHAFLSE